MKHSLVGKIHPKRVFHTRGAAMQGYSEGWQGEHLDTDAAEYLLAMAGSHEGIESGLLQEIAETVRGGIVVETLRRLLDFGCLEASADGSIAGASVRGVTLLDELKAQRRSRQRAARLGSRVKGGAPAIHGEQFHNQFNFRSV